MLKGTPRLCAAAAAGALVGGLGGLIGLGGAEFRLPILISVFRFGALKAVIINKATSLVVVAAALPSRSTAIPLAEVLAHSGVALNLLAGSLAGAWLGAGWATQLSSVALHRTIALLLLAIAGILLIGHDAGASVAIVAPGPLLWTAGVTAGFGIGVVASLLGVAGGELLIPALVLLYGLDPKLAGSISLAVSLPTMLVGFVRFSRDRSFTVLARNRAFLLVLAVGSIAGAIVGASLLTVVPGEWLLPILSLILVISAFKVWRHR